jgi:hypothetical protein
MELALVDLKRTLSSEVWRFEGREYGDTVSTTA